MVNKIRFSEFFAFSPYISPYRNALRPSREQGCTPESSAKVSLSILDLLASLGLNSLHRHQDLRRHHHHPADHRRHLFALPLSSFGTVKWGSFEIFLGENLITSAICFKQFFCVFKSRTDITFISWVTMWLGSLAYTRLAYKSRGCESRLSM